MDDLRARKASELLGSLLSPAAASRMGQWTRFTSAWARIAGEQYASHARPVDLANGIVVIEAEHPGWIQLLQLEQSRFLDKLKDAFPELDIRGVAFKLAKDGSIALPDRFAKPKPKDGSGPRPETPPAAPRPAKEPEKSVEETISGVQDPDFRALLSSLAKTLETNCDDSGPAAGKRGKP